MTGYVSTRYYRAPEIMLTWQKYDIEVDVWSAGCIFAEMLEGKPLFPGKDHVNQFSIITELLGTPPQDVIETICSENTLRFVQSLPKRERQPLSAKFKNADPQAIDLLEKMLVLIRENESRPSKDWNTNICLLTTTLRMSPWLMRNSIGPSMTPTFPSTPGRS